MKPDLICVPPDIVPQVWPFVSGLMWVAVKKGGLSSFAPIQDDVLNGRSLLWIAWGGDTTKVEAAGISQITETEWRKVCTIVAVAGKQMERWLSLLGQIESYAKQEGCTGMRIMGRRGWEKVLPDYHVKRIVIEKVL